MPTAATAEPCPHLTRMAVARRLAAGYRPDEAARAVGVDDAAADALLADPGFRELVDAYRGIADRPEDEQVARLVRVAKCVLEDALDRGDMRAALFVIHEAEERGRSPARVLAERAVRALRRRRAAAEAPAAPPPPAEAPPPAPARVRTPPTYKARLIRLASARLIAALRAEHEALAGTQAEKTPSPLPLPPSGGRGGELAAPPLLPPLPRQRERAGVRARTLPPSPVRRVGEGRGEGGPAPDPAPTTPAPPPRPLNRHERRRLAALRRKRGRAPPPAA